MPYLAVDKDGTESIYDSLPKRHNEDYWGIYDCFIELPKGTIEKILGRSMTWEDEPIKIE